MPDTPPPPGPVATALLGRIAAAACARHPGRVLRIGIDGVDGAGKTVFADALAAHVGRPVIRARLDDFHHPRAVRYRRGRDSPEGFFRDSYDYPALRRMLLDPLAPGGDRRYRDAAFDTGTDRPVRRPWRLAPPDAALIVDGIFLHRPELRDHWDYSVFLRVDFAVSIPRGARRGYGDPDPAAVSNHRYVQGQRYYLDRCRPAEHATVVIDYDDLAAPRVLRTGGER